MKPDSKVTFTPPAGAVPEGTSVGDTFDLVSTFRLERDGKVCLTQMGEHKMAGYDRSEAVGQDKQTPYRSEASAMAGTAPAPTYG